MYFSLTYYKKGDLIGKLDKPIEINYLTHETSNSITADEDCIALNGRFIGIKDLEAGMKKAKKERDEWVEIEEEICSGTKKKSK